MQEKSKYQEIELFKKLGEGSVLALKEIHAKYSTQLEKYCFFMLKNKELSKDIVLDVMYALWKKKEEVASMEYPVAWLKTCVQNKVKNILESKKIMPTVVLNEQTAIAVTENIENKMDGKRLSALIDQAIEGLPPQQRRIIRLRKDFGMNRKEIAKECNLSESTVKNLMTYALRKLNKIVDDYRKL
jgi:RNA polymerase sigma factor (sigma-70 family)